MFGFVAAGAGIDDFTKNAGANWAEFWDGDGEWPFDEDTDVFPLGEDLYNSGQNDICTVLKKLPSHGNRKDCSPCGESAELKPAGFDKFKYPSYLP